MICRNSLFGRNVAEHSFLLVVVAAHLLVSLAFLHSDEFLELKLQRTCVFQQTAKVGSSEMPEGARQRADFFVVPTITFRLLFVFVILSHDGCRPVHFAVTAN